MSSHDPFFANIAGPERFRAAIRRFDELNAADPHHEVVDGEARPRELLHALRLSAWVMMLAPDASEALRLAARGQHLCRWMIPRAHYEMTRAGYHQWRNELKRFHAAQSGAVLRASGYAESEIAQVASLNLKEHFPADPESRVLEDALCLVFLEFQLGDLARKTDETKVINALQKSWKKMTPAAHARALDLPYGPRERELIEKALRP